MRALVLGGAACLWEDLRALGAWTGLTVATNDAGAFYPGILDIWATLHPEKLFSWTEERARRGGNDDYEVWAWPGSAGVTRAHRPTWSAAGSSGLYAVEVALELGAEQIVLAGVPMDAQPHVTGGEAWAHADDHRGAWLESASRLRGRVTSLSGWTRELLGAAA